MFIYDLFKQILEKGSIPADELPSERSVEPLDLSSDAVVVVFPFKEPDTFSFDSLTSNPMGLKEGETSSISQFAQGNPMEVLGPVPLDGLITQLSIQSGKTSHQDGLQLVMKDPHNTVLRLINPGDWIAVWMFNNSVDANALRAELKKPVKSSPTLNGFKSGLKFVGKCLAPRAGHTADANSGTFIKTVAIRASAFSELDAIQYYDPYIGSTNRARQLEFMMELTSLLNKDFIGIPRSTSDIISILVPSCLGKPARSGTQATPNTPLLIPSPIASIFGFKNATNFADVLTTIIGVQKYSDDYLPPTTNFSPSPHPNVLKTDSPLKGIIHPQIAPFNGIPLWSILEQHLVPAANEMYSTLRYGPNGGINPHLIVRQIPFNSGAFIKANPSIPATEFLSLPRWKVHPGMVYAYDTGKTDATRFNYVHVQVSAAINSAPLEVMARNRNVPRWDAADISRNGLKPYITSVNGAYAPTLLEDGQIWTDLATDRIIGAHLKLSGSITLVGVQEPICVGDNLEYDGFVYHIENVEHRLQVNPQSGHKSFQTVLAISQGVPATGVALPEIAVRQFETQFEDVQNAELADWQPSITSGEQQSGHTHTQERIGTAKLKSTSEPVVHKTVPSGTFEED